MDEITKPEAKKTAAASLKEKLKKSRPVAWLWRRRVGLLAFFMPFVLFCAAFCAVGIYPAGDRQVLNFDLWHQYYPFLLKFWDHLHEGTSLFYDWSMGMGTNFLSLLSYYGASPLNLLLGLAAAREFRVGFTLLIAVRAGFAGLFTAKFLQKLVPASGISAAFFGLTYALCGYVAGYYWNVMWLDAVALFPLLCLGILLLFREGKAKLYVFALFLTLFSNYYIGYMCCIGAVLFFFALALTDAPTWKNLCRKAARFAVFSLLGAALAAPLLLPAFFGLRETYSVTAGGPEEILIYRALRDTFSGFADLHIPNVMEGELPNIFCGALTAFFASAFFWAKAIDWKKKLAAFLVLLFFVLSFECNFLDYFWHAFHFTNMIPFRFSFLFSFLITVLAWQYYRTGMKGLDWVDLVGALIFCGAVGYCMLGLESQTGFLCSVAAFGIGILVSVLHSLRLMPKKVLSAAVCGVLLFEMGSGIILGVREVGTTPYDGYGAGESGDKITELLETVRLREENATELYRTECTEWYSLNDSCLYGYNGISQFSSMANLNASAFAKNIGLSADPGSNRFAYVYTTPLNNTLLGVKYLISPRASLADDYTRRLSAFSGENPVALYEYEGFAGIGFVADRKAADFSFSPEDDPAVMQNRLFTALTGLEKPLFSSLEEVECTAENLVVSKVTPGIYDYQIASPDRKKDETRVTFRYTVPAGGTVCIYADLPGVQYMRVNNGWYSVEDFANYTCIGAFSTGQEFTVSAEFDPAENTADSFRLLVTLMDDGVWQEGLSVLSAGKFQTESLGDTSLAGNVTCKEDGYLYFSIPASSGWKLSVDGKETEIEPFAGYMIGVSLPKGEHHIELKFVPRGFVPGCLIALAGVLLAAVLWIGEKKGKPFLPDRPEPVPPEPCGEAPAAEKAEEKAEEAAPEEEK